MATKNSKAAPAAPTAPAPTAPEAPLMYGLCVPYNPQKAHNAAKWAPVLAAIQASKGKGVTLATLKAVTLKLYDPAFCNYVVKRGWVAPLGAKHTVKGVTYTSKA